MQRVLLLLLLMPGIMQAAALVSAGSQMTDQDVVNDFFDYLEQRYKDAPDSEKPVKSTELFNAILVIGNKEALIESDFNPTEPEENQQKHLNKVITVMRSKGPDAARKAMNGAIDSRSDTRGLYRYKNQLFERRGDVIIKPEDRIIGLPGFSTTTTRRPLVSSPVLSAAVASGKAASALPPVSVLAAAAPATKIDMPVKDRDELLRNPALSAAPSARRSFTWQRAVAVATVAGIVGALAWYFLKKDIQITTQHAA